MSQWREICFGFLLTFSLNLLAFAQIGDEKEFKKQGWDKFDFSKKKITRAQLDRLKYDAGDFEPVDELAIVRGIIFGKRGRIFIERSIQDYLEKQSWYKPNKNFKNSMLTAMERANLDLIRLAEAARHLYVEPGDLRYWRSREIPEDKIWAGSAADWQVMAAEIEAIHGKTFPEQEWMQKYFDERYWYKRSPNYSPASLNEFERKNLEKITAKKEETHKTAVSSGDMDKFQTTLLTRELLKDVTLNDLRMMRLEFWARRGRKFTTAGFAQAFEWRDWYKPLKDQSKVKLGKIEEQNVKLLEEMEAEWRELLATKELNEEMLFGLFIEDLRVLRNEIYARHGRVFKDKELQKYFASQSWYKPNADFKEELLTDLEFKNLSTIKQAEDAAISKFVKVEG